MAGLFLSRRKKPAAGFEPATGFLVPTGNGVCSDRPRMPWRPGGLKDERSTPKMLAHFGSPARRFQRSRSALLDSSAPP